MGESVLPEKSVLVIHITPDLMAAAYELLRLSAPFRSWKLPHPDEVKFGVIAHKDRYGDHRHWRNVHEIRMSVHKIGSLLTLLKTMGHEMIHQKQVIDGTATRAEHNEAFESLAKLVCKRHCWDYMEFR